MAQNDSVPRTIVGTQIWHGLDPGGTIEPDASTAPVEALGNEKLSNGTESFRVLGILALALAGCSAGNGDGGPDGDKPLSPLANAMAVPAYCERFAEAYSARLALEFVPDSVRSAKTPDLVTWISNRFQPPDARFVSAYACRFEATDARRRHRRVDVQLLLTQTRRFAEYTQWDDLQTIPIEYVVDEIDGRAGYGVFKYLETR